MIAERLRLSGLNASGDWLFVNDERAVRVTLRFAFGFNDAEFMSTTHPTQSFLQQPDRHVTNRFVRGRTTPTYRTLLDGVGKVIIMFGHFGYLIAEVIEDIGHRWQTDAQLGGERQHFEGQVTDPSQCPEVLERLREAGSSCA